MYRNLGKIDTQYKFTGIDAKWIAKETVAFMPDYIAPSLLLDKIGFPLGGYNTYCPAHFYGYNLCSQTLSPDNGTANSLGPTLRCSINSTIVRNTIQDNPTRSNNLVYMGTQASPAYGAGVNIDGIFNHDYAIYTKNCFGKINIEEYREKDLIIYIYFDPASSLVQVYYEDYLNPNNLLDSVILYNMINPEDGYRIGTAIAYWPVYPLVSKYIPIIPDRSFNPNVNYTNTSIILQ